MKSLMACIVMLSAVRVCAAQATPTKPQTLADIKHIYLNQRVVVRGHVMSLGLSDWEQVKQSGNDYAETSESAGQYAR